MAPLLALLIGLGTLAIGCAKGTYLEVNVTGAGLPEIHSMVVTLKVTPSNGGPVLQSQGPVGGDAGAVIKLPTSFAFKLDDESGTLEITALAYDGSNKLIATASGGTTIMHAQTWTIVLNLVPS